MKTRAYVDTNCFIHLRDMKDLPWSDLLEDAQEIEIVVAPVVIDELDRLKTNREGKRRRDRSRAALDLLEAASTQPDHVLSLKTTPTELTLRLAPGRRIDWDRWPDLDPTRADDQLVASALDDDYSGPVVLVSFDRGPLIRARMSGLKAYVSPVSWQLPDEADEETREVARLRRELTAAQATRPTLDCTFAHMDGDGIIHQIVPHLPPLSSQTREVLIQELVDRFPKAQLRATSKRPYDLSLISGLSGVSDWTIEKYHSDYAAFLASARDTFAGLHDRVAESMRFVQVTYHLENASQVTAQRLLVRYRADGEHLLIVKESTLEGLGGTPGVFQPPEVPREQYISPLAGLHQRDRDPTGFYWLDQPDAEGNAALKCEEFRAGRRWSDIIWVFAAPGEPIFEVDIEVSATNLTAPIRLAPRVEVRAVDTDWTDPRVLERLPAWVADVLEREMPAG